MLQKYGVRFSNYLLQNHIIKDTEKQTYIYGFVISASTLLSLIFLLVLSIAINRAIWFPCFFVAFFVPRLFCGGYHAKTYHRCFLITNALFLTISALTEIILTLSITSVIPFFVLFTGIVIFLFAPIKNINHPLSVRSQKRNRIISRVLCVIEMFLILLGYYFDINPRIIIFSAISYVVVAVMMLVAIIQSKKGDETDEKSIIKSC